jgi:4-amino-4-deoxy-L-arabinose transferase-like glycosyltransferase
MFGSSQVSPLQSGFTAFLLLIVGLFFIGLLKSPNRGYLLSLFFSAFLVRVIFVYIIYYYLIGTGGDGFAFMDDRTYDKAGSRIAAALRAGKDGYDLHIREQNPGYFLFNGWFYSLLGRDTLSARMVNVLLSSLTVILIFEIVRILFKTRCAKIAGLLAAFMPGMVYWGALQFKDIALVFVMIYTVYILVEKKDQKITVFSILAVMLSLFAMWFLRKDFTLPYIGIILLWLTLRYTGVDGWIEKMRQRGLSGLAGGAILVLGIGMLIGIVNTEAGQDFLERNDKIMSENSEFVENASSAQIGFSRHLRITSLSDGYKIPFAVGFTVIAPLPVLGQLTNPKLAGVTLYSYTNLFFILFLPFVVLGFILSKDLSFANSIMLRWFPIMLLIGISVMFMGILRYKEQLMPFFIIWAAVGLSQRGKYKGIISSIYLIGFSCVITAILLAYSSR